MEAGFQFPHNLNATNENGTIAVSFSFVGLGGGNWPCRPRLRLHAKAAPDYKQHAGAVCFTPSAPHPSRTRIQLPPTIQRIK